MEATVLTLYEGVGAVAFLWPLLPVFATIPAFALLIGIFVLMLKAQRKADHFRRTYEISFPRGMSQDQVLDFVRSAISELPTPRLLQPVFAIVFETYADVNGKVHYLHVPGHVSTKVDKLLSRKIEGISIEPVKPADDKVRTTAWTEAAELTMKGFNQTLRTRAEVASSIDSNFDDLDTDEALVLQWVVIPDSPRRPTPEDKDKVTDHTLHAVARIGATGEDAKQNLANLFASLRSVNSHGARFLLRFMWGVGDRINRRAGTLGYPIFLNATEFSTLMGWELDGKAGTFVARKLPPSAMHDKEGMILGFSNYAKSRGQLICMPYEAGDMHVRVMGGSGTGKSNFLLHYALQAVMKPDTAFFMLEPAGDLAWDFLTRIPPHRVKDVIYLDPLDTDWPIGLNPLKGTDPERITSHVVSMFRNLSVDSWGHQLQRVLTTAVMTSALLGLTLYDTEQLLVNEPYRQQQLRKLKRSQYPEIFQEWDWIGNKADMVVDSSVNRLKSFLSARMIRNMLSQREGLDFDRIIKDHKILIVPLPAARMGQLNASAIGQLVREMAWNAAMKQSPGNRQRSIVMMDEFQNFSDFATSKSDPFAEARKYKQQYVIANQYTEQIPEAVRHTVDKNVATQIVFRLDPEDARKVKDRYKPLTEDDIAFLPRYTVAGRIMTSTGIAPTVTFQTLPAPERTHFEHEIIDQTRRVYAKPVHEVDADVLTRHKHEETKRKPTIGRVEE